MGLGLKGDRVANTPTWVFPPSLGGSTVTLTRASEEDDSTDKTSSYVKYSGEFTAPEATSSGPVMKFRQWYTP